MPVFVASRRRTRLSLDFPDALILDVTSRGPEPWVRLSPFYPHGGIPVPGHPDRTSQSVEGLWQALKVFATEPEGFPSAGCSITGPPGSVSSPATRPWSCRRHHQR
jgi:hypothetical protein